MSADPIAQDDMSELLALALDAVATDENRAVMMLRLAYLRLDPDRDATLDRMRETVPRPVVCL